ncbi:MAG: hypothetical protein H0X64_06915 [Gemmatimonadaceae bacterium]|nr:hypothetical protein [Gemmatimonadaceae bacterium]
MTNGIPLVLRGTLRRLRSAALALTFGIIAVESAVAQEGVAVTIAPDAEVRATLVPGAGARVTGRFVSLTRDTLAVAVGSERMRRAMPVQTVARVEVRGPRDRKRGAVIGAGLLGGIAVVFGGIDVSKGSLATDEYIGAIAANAVIGGLIGAALAPRGWIPVPLPR